MESLLNSFVQYGALGCVAAVSLYQVYVLQRKLIDVIEKNTIALTKMLCLLETIETSLRYGGLSSVSNKKEKG
jgi:hypothetical protein